MAGVLRKAAAARSRKAARKNSRAPAKGRRARPAALAAFAHEIRTTLTGILALGELLATADLGERERQWATAVRSAAEHLSALTSLIIDADKATASGLVLRRDVFRPRLVALGAADSLRARAAIKGLSAEVSVPDDLPAFVRGDPVRLRAALENLIDNAVKFTERGSVGLTVSAEKAPNRRVRLVFEVSDSGRGLDRAAIRRLFRPYAQEDDEVARLFGGAGLGLVAVEEIAKAMGGELTISSQPRRGSLFRLAVVLAQANAPRVQDASARGPSRAAARLRLLCAEDNPFGRVILDHVLTELGHTADFVGTGAAAVEAAGRGGYDAVLIDLTLPVLDGISATRRIRALPGPAAAVPIIGISGASETAAETARNAGMTAFLHKPISPRLLAQQLAEVTKRIGYQAEG